ncbi:hypothetical protein [Prochlorococcus marinus]
MNASETFIERNSGSHHFFENVDKELVILFVGFTSADGLPTIINKYSEP